MREAGETEPMPEPHLRQRLIVDLAASHQRLDDRVSQFDLGKKSGVTAFLLMHEAGLSVLSRTQLCPDTSTMVTDLHARLKSDLAAHQIASLSTNQSLAPDTHPMAAKYVLAGSRLGAEVLKRRWLDGAVSKTGFGEAYMRAPRHIEVWKQFLAEASLMPAQTKVADKIVDGASAIFDLYFNLAEEALNGAVFNA